MYVFLVEGFTPSRAGKNSSEGRGFEVRVIDLCRRIRSA